MSVQQQHPEQAGLGVLVGAAVVAVAAITLAMVAGPDFGRTRTINYNLAPPHIPASAFAGDGG